MISRELLHNTLSMQSTSGETSAMRRYIRRYARKLSNVRIREDDGNMYITRGEADVYPCVIAHTDTVHSIDRDFVVTLKDGVYYGRNQRTGKQHGVGGDDKSGITVALQALRDFPAIKIAFFRDEEVGCVGSKRADMSFFKDCAFVIQCDRRGNSDVVKSIYGTQLYDSVFSAALQPFLTHWKFKETSGALTDVYTLRRLGLDVASFNMSAGYYDPHTPRETVSLADMDKVYGFVADVITHLSYTRWVSVPRSYSQFSFFEEEEEEDEEETYEYAMFDDDERDFIEAWMRSSGEHIDTCPMCGDNAVEWDDTAGGYFCMICLDYIFISSRVEA